MSKKKARAERTETKGAYNIGQMIEARIHQFFTNMTDPMFAEGKIDRQERIALSSGIGNALDAFTQTVEELAPTLYSRAPWQDADDDYDLDLFDGDEMKMFLAAMLEVKELDTDSDPSPNPHAAKLRAYWVRGAGAAKIRWGSPGDFKRCVRKVRKYVGEGAEGLCNVYHRDALGVAPGQEGKDFKLPILNRAIKLSYNAEDGVVEN